MTHVESLQLKHFLNFFILDFGLFGLCSHEGDRIFDSSKTISEVFLREPVDAIKKEDIFQRVDPLGIYRLSSRQEALTIWKPYLSSLNFHQALNETGLKGMIILIRELLGDLLSCSVVELVISIKVVSINDVLSPGSELVFPRF